MNASPLFLCQGTNQQIRRPISEVQRLEIAMKEVVARQAFEQAAILRDQLRALRTKPEDSSPKS